jgi:exodeoxyribonuclease VII large subunit
MDVFATPEPPVPPAPHVHSVTEITRAVREILETGMGFVWVEGEISNYRKQASGHQYFTLKDAQCQLPCVLFARPGQWRKMIPLSDGMQVQVRGAMTVYETRGQYQLNVQLVQAGGAGLLQAKFEALKRKLEAEGMFDPARKRELPRFPTMIAIVTSPTGAALRDMLNILTRRAPWLRILVSPVRVQGEGAAREIASAVEELNCGVKLGLPCVDVIVVARGGGSAEDLWQFNEEVLARAIAASAIPVVSAVGHEIDFTIADFVADLRAPTPSAAAELIVPERNELIRRIGQLETQARRCVGVCIERHKSQIAVLGRGGLFAEPRRRLDDATQRLDTAADAVTRRARVRLVEARQQADAFLASLRQHRPDQVIAFNRQKLLSTRHRMTEHARRDLAERRQRFNRLREMLRLLAPQTVLNRGFSITTLIDGTVIDSVVNVRPGARIRTRLKDGTFDASVEPIS